MKDKNLRKAVGQLTNKLGFSYSDWFDRPIIGEYDYIDGANRGRQPITREEFQEFEALFKLLMEYLNLTVFEGKEVRPKKIKARSPKANVT